MTLKKYYHIGIAVDTPHGLMVPKIRDANNKSISVISKDLKEVSDLCRNLKIDKKRIIWWLYDNYKLRRHRWIIFYSNN
jgi:pyruvate dehydrogenase E2 component (dihydrolipoamide acetyltransferase)